MVNTLLVSSQYTFDIFPHYLKLRSLTRSLMKPHVSISFENSKYVVKTATTVKELAEVLKLRFQVFQSEFSGKKPHLALLKYDIDTFDFKCDHLIVKDKATSAIVATYRLLASSSARSDSKFYSQGEFDLDHFMTLQGNKLELGRACVHKEFRNGEVISLLWRGLCQYAQKANCKFMFGCSSITFEELPLLSQIRSELEERGVFSDEYGVHALENFSMKHAPELSADSSKGKSALNSLINMYLLAGARLSPNFAYDSDMKCVDIFTVVDFERVSPSFLRRFLC